MAIHLENQQFLKYASIKKTIFKCLLIKLFLFLNKTSFAQSGKIVYPHRVFWYKFEINQLDKNNRFGVGLDFVYRRKNALNQGNMFQERLRESICPWFHYQFSSYARFSLSPIGYMNTHEYTGKIEDFQRRPYHEWRTTFCSFTTLNNWEGKLCTLGDTGTNCAGNTTLTKITTSISIGFASVIASE
ncbi:hypothetical protein [Thermoflexibacter ruber]|uniref:hypothetical protein n=1 Tax=Thermoflexibacter ruber TaxID=1003 RepID=UPI001160D7FF|nr:hypothetical protein [Thermoflexibacter ruber]